MATVLPSEQTITERDNSGVPIDPSVEKNVMEGKAEAKTKRRRKPKQAKQVTMDTPIEPDDDNIHANVIGGTERFHTPHKSKTMASGNIFSNPKMMESHLRRLI